MQKLKSIVAAGLVAALLTALPGLALAQSNPGWTTGQKLTAGQWNAQWASKQDTLGYTPLNQAGGVMGGRLVTAPSGSTTSGLNLTPGGTPASPANGDLWTTSAGLFVQINGGTVGPLAAGLGAILVNGTTPTTGYSNTQILASNGTVLSAYSVSGTGSVALTNSPSIVTPAFGFGTGGTSQITANSTNTGFQNQINIFNSGTVSNSGTISALDIALTGAGATNFVMDIVGGATPTAAISSGTGTTGGMSIGPQAGTLTLTSPSLTNLFGPTVTIGNALNAASTINLTGASGGGITVNIASAGNGLNALNVYNGAGSPQKWIPGGGATQITFPTATDTLVGKATTDILTNKTIASSTDTLGGVTMGLGSDATGDIYYRNGSGLLTRLPVGSNGTALELVGGIPSWQPVSGTGTVTSVNIIAGTNIAISGTCNSVSIISCTASINGTIGSVNGGTGNSSPTAHTLGINEAASAQNLVGPGTLGQALVSNGVGNDPSFQSGGWVLLNTLTGGGTSVNDTTHITSAYNEYEIVFTQIIPSVTGAVAQFQIHSGGAFKSTGYINGGSASGTTGIGVLNGATGWLQMVNNIALDVNNNPKNSSPGMSGTITLFNPSASQITMMRWDGSYAAATYSTDIHIGGYWNTAGVIDGFQFNFGGTTTFTGTIEIYGRL